MHQFILISAKTIQRKLNGGFLYVIITARKLKIWGKVIFLHHFVILFTGGACVVARGGHAWFYSGGMHGCSRGGACVVAWGACVVLFGGHAWLLPGGVRGCSGGVHGFIRRACMVLFGGHAWFYLGGMHGFIRGACVVLFGGACVVFSVFSDTMRYGQ